MNATRPCPRCGRENEADATNCVRCGINLNEVQEAYQAPAEAPEFFCYRHPREATNLRCGRCDKPICVKCAVIGPNGVRCRECAKLNIAVRPGAIVHEAKRGAQSLLRFGPWGIWIMIVLIGMVFSFVRSCGSAPSHRNVPDEPPPFREER